MTFKSGKKSVLNSIRIFRFCDKSVVADDRNFSAGKAAQFPCSKDCSSLRKGYLGIQAFVDPSYTRDDDEPATPSLWRY